MAKKHTTSKGSSSSRAEVAKRKGTPKSEESDEDLVDVVEALAELSGITKRTTIEELPSTIEEQQHVLVWKGKGSRSRRRRLQNQSTRYTVWRNHVVKDEETSDSGERRRGSGDVPASSEDSDLRFGRSESPSSPLPNEGSSAYDPSSSKGCKRNVEKRDGPISIRNKRVNANEQAKNRPKSLTEEEKELRRLHRIEANRESARQTIRKKQAVIGQLSKEAAELNSQKEQLKLELAKAKQDCKTFYEANRSFRQQLAEIGCFPPPLHCNPSKWRDAKHDMVVANTAAMHLWLAAKNSNSGGGGGGSVATSGRPSSSAFRPEMLRVQINMQHTLDSVESEFRRANASESISEPEVAVPRPLSRKRKMSVPSEVSAGILVNQQQQRAHRQLRQQRVHQQRQEQQHQLQIDRHKQLQEQQHQQHIHQQQQAQFLLGKKDAIAANAAQLARRKRMEVTRMKSLIRQTSSAMAMPTITATATGNVYV